MYQVRVLRFGSALLVPPALLIALLAGCGGEADRGQAIVVPEPGTTASTSGAGTNTTAGASDVAASPDRAPTEATAARVAEGFGTLRGRVVFAGDPPQPAIKVPQGQASKDPEYCAADEPILSQHLVINPDNKGVQNALVYISRPTAVSPEALQAAQQTEVIFDQEKCIFIPHVLGVMKDTEVTIVSSDPVNHNVNASLGSFRINQVFSPNSSRKVSVGSAATRSPGPVVCDVHPWMKAYWMICDNPYFAVTDENGDFVIEDVPAGTQSVLVWHEATDYLTDRRGDPVDIAADDEVSVEYTIEPGSVRPE